MRILTWLRFYSRQQSVLCKRKFIPRLQNDFKLFLKTISCCLTTARVLQNFFQSNFVVRVEPRAEVASKNRNCANPVNLVRRTATNFQKHETSCSFFRALSVNPTCVANNFSRKSSAFPSPSNVNLNLSFKIRHIIPTMWFPIQFDRTRESIVHLKPRENL